jgi:uncharacterized protein (TIGR03663 family)
MSREYRLKLCAVLAAFVVALAFRLPALNERPFHGDEANQAMKAGILLETGKYTYDPHEHHGPTLYYGVLPILWGCGVDDIDDATDGMLRLLPTLFGAATVLLLLLVPGLSALEAGLAALFMALSHALVFYSRYFIQESMLVFFAFLTLIALTRVLQRPTWTWAIIGGLGVGLTFATKETSVVLFAGMGFALMAAWGWSLATRAPAFSWVTMPRYIAASVLVALVVSVVFYSSFFTHWRGVLDSVLTFNTYAGRAEGQGSTALHDKPWYAYFEMLAYTYREAGPRWTEAPALLLGGVGVVVALLAARWAEVPRAFMLRTLTLYTLFVTVVYCLIPYKTPWNLLPFWQPLLVLAGVAAAAMLRRVPRLPALPARIAQVIVAVLLIACFGLAARQSWLGNFEYPADTRNPYVYAHTSQALFRLTRRVEAIAAIAPEGKDLHINILKPDADYWPLPWYLRAYPKVGYWTSPPENADADIIIADAKLGPFVQSHIKDEYQFEFHALRPGVNLLVFIKKTLWDEFME